MLTISSEIAKLQQELAERTAPRKVSAEAVRDVAELLKSCGYRDDLNPELFRVLSRLGASEVEKTTLRGLFLKGDPGIGKSMGLEILSKQFGWVYREAVEIEGFYARQPSYDEWERYCRGCDFFEVPQTMVIDDLGVEKFPYYLFGNPCNPLQELLEIRYRISYNRDRTRTIVTTNMNDGEILRRYGYRIVDRLNEMYSVVTVKGKSLRTPTSSGR